MSGIFCRPREDGIITKNMIMKLFHHPWPVLFATTWFNLSCGVPVHGSMTEKNWIEAENIRSAMRTVCEYAASHPGGTQGELDGGAANGWVRSTFFIGVIESYRVTNESYYLRLATEWAEKDHWQPGPRPRHADDECCGQTYLVLNELSPSPEKIAGIKAQIDFIIANPKSGREDWWWCDALFMAPPVYAQLGRATGNPEYFALLDKMYWDTTDFLFDKEAGLFYRDARFLNQHDKNGGEIFWARGNGWVIAGLARVLSYLPKTEPRYRDYEKLFKRMAASLAPLQGNDGLWRTNLLYPSEFPAPETSGTGFFCYAFAWGVNHGLLPRATYEPIIKRAWVALCKNIQPDGKIGWVQVIGCQPNTVLADDTQDYGAGAFLLAGTEILRLVENPEAQRAN
jgi:unsaturated rhamnogalacturonyl hydrolase